MDSLPETLEIYQTADGSPTICFSQGSRHEKMHNSQGALGESLYIYGHALKRVLLKTDHTRVLSVGLGLGYCEMIALGLSLAHGRPMAVWSFEADEYLRTSMLNWLHDEHVLLEGTYNSILDGVAFKIGLSAQAIKARMRQAEIDGSWQLRRSFPEDAGGISHVNCVLFDAYSAKTSPELWQENLFMNQVAEMLAKDCVFTTYAATGVLNRSLVKLRFELELRAGFAGKRQSTLAVRGIYADT